MKNKKLLMAKNIQEYVVTKVIEHLERSNVATKRMFDLLKLYTRDFDLIVDTCGFCNDYCVFTYRFLILKFFLLKKNDNL